MKSIVLELADRSCEIARRAQKALAGFPRDRRRWDTGA